MERLIVKIFKLSPQLFPNLEINFEGNCTNNSRLTVQE